MIQWKQRLYAFLLRRVLGPLLDGASLEKLHQSIEVSLQEGKFVLKDVGLNAFYLSERVAPHVRIRRARVERLEILLTLVEHDCEEGASTNSFAWRAMQLGTTYSSGTSSSVSLVAQIEIDGLYLELIPPGDQTQNPSPAPAAPENESLEETPPSKSLLSSYIDAALASLRLSLQLNSLRVRVCSPEKAENRETWLEFRLKSASYNDVDTVTPPPSEVSKSKSGYETVLHKTLELNRLTVLTGETTVVIDSEDNEELQGKANSPIALLEGTSRIRLRVVEYTSSGSPPRRGVESRDKKKKKVQQDIEVTLSQRLNLSVDAKTLLQIKTVVQSMQRTLTQSATTTTSVEEVEEHVNQEEQHMEEDQADLNTIDGIMKQYHEARLLAEQNQFRGGILLPSEEQDDDGGVNFDAFFDANEQSFARYSTILQESILIAQDEGDSNFVHTKVRFHLAEGSAKLFFAVEGENAPTRRIDEYILLTFTELNMSSSHSFHSADYSFSVAHLDIEDSQVESQLEGPSSLGRKVEIGSVLRFSQDLVESDMNEHVLLQAPCISMTAKTKHEDGCSTEVELAIEPMELTYRHGTMTNLANFLSKPTPGASSSEVEGQENNSVHSIFGKKLAMYVSCSSVTLTLPVLVEKDWDSLYQRCGYGRDSPWTTRSSLGVLIEQLSLESRHEETEPAICLSCNHIIAYAASPNRNHLSERRPRQFDILCLSGRTEVDPCIPVSLKIWRSSHEGNPSDTCGAKAFPKVPAISSFKARQEDEDDDNRIDRVLSSKLEGLNVGTRSDLRGNDPQPDMLFEASKSDIVIQVHIPEIIGDISIEELCILSNMLGFVVPPFDETTGRQSKSRQKLAATRSSIALECDFVSFALLSSNQLAPHEEHGQETGSISFLLNLDELKAHFLKDGSYVRHVRLLSSELDFFEASNICNPAVRNEPYMRDRIGAFHERIASNRRVTPLFYRSHLFPPISRQSPSFLVDMINHTPFNEQEDQALIKKTVYLTLYDMTYRYNFDSRWFERLNWIVKNLSNHGEKEEVRQATHSPSKLTRVFFSLADCNIDYSSSERFKTPSRMILRIGDFRLSSNVMWPKPSVQAFNLALNDASVYLCQIRFPYNFENTSLSRSSAVMSQEDISLAHLALPSDADSETVLKAMDYLTILMLESFDSIIAITNAKPEKKAPDPYLRASLTIGELSMFACKDSFSRFASTVGELTAELTALDKRSLEALKLKSYSFVEEPVGSEGKAAAADVSPTEDNSSLHAKFYALEDLKRQSALRPSAGTNKTSDRVNDFLLDGYDWTTIDQDESSVLGIPPGEEQAARWYSETETISSTSTTTTTTTTAREEVAFLPTFSSSENNDQKQGPDIISHHFPLHPVSDPLGDGDMSITAYAKVGSNLQVQSRILIHDFSIKLRWFDGYDWPELLNEQQRRTALGNRAFIIDLVQKVEDKAKEEVSDDLARRLDGSSRNLERKAVLMGDLLAGAPETKTFQGMLLPEERGAQLKEQEELRRLGRRTGKYFQLSASGISLRLDSLEESSDHRLASCLNVKAQDFFVAETISSDRPVKLAGEWVNEAEHPRLTNDGLLMMKMVTWHPRSRVTPNDEIVNEECEAAIKILPLRCQIDQRAVRFVRAIFRGEDDQESCDEGQLPPGLYAVPPPLFRSFRVMPFKLKVDYWPEKLDTHALRNGAVVELVNLSPIDAMVLTLEKVEADNVIGFGEVLSITVKHWIQDICATQIFKFVTNARPLEPITHVGTRAADLVVLPWEAVKNGESLKKALRAGVKSFSSALAYETFTMTSRVTQLIADQVARASMSSVGGNMLPSRPLRTPRGVLDTTPHALESITRGFQAANYTVVIVPYREYRRRGAKGAATSVLKGIPVAIAAPASGTAEAISFALLGARNQIRPDIRKEEEASQRGLHMDSG